jgi:hypothetical protein
VCLAGRTIPDRGGDWNRPRSQLRHGRNGTLDSPNILIEPGLESGLNGMAAMPRAACSFPPADQARSMFSRRISAASSVPCLRGSRPHQSLLRRGGFENPFRNAGCEWIRSGDPLARPRNGPFLRKSQAFHSGPIHASRALMPARIGDHRSHFAGFGLTALRRIMVEATGPKEHPHHRRSTVVSSAPTPASAARVRSRASLSPSAWTGWIQT